MNIPIFFKELGPGRFFGHGRIFGIHLRDMTNLGKAQDPYINVRTLARLSRIEDQDIREAVVHNLIEKLRIGFNPQLLTKFNVNAIIETMVEAKEIAPLFIEPAQTEEKEKPLPILYRMIMSASPVQLEQLGRSHCLQVRIIVAGTPETPIETLLYLAKEENNLAGEYAFKTLKIKGILTEKILHGLSDSRNPLVLLKILEHPNTSRKTIIKMAVEGKTYEYDHRSYYIGQEAYNVIAERKPSADELRQIADTTDWTILLKAIAQSSFPRDLKLKLVIGHNPRVAEEAWKYLDKQLLTPEELSALAHTSSGLARIEIMKHPLTPPEVKRAY